MYQVAKDMKMQKMGDLCLNALVLNVESLRLNLSNRRETGWPVERGGRTRYSSINRFRYVCASWYSLVR